MTVTLYIHYRSDSFMCTAAQYTVISHSSLAVTFQDAFILCVSGSHQTWTIMEMLWMDKWQFNMCVFSVWIVGFGVVDHDYNIFKLYDGSTLQECVVYISSVFTKMCRHAGPLKYMTITYPYLDSLAEFPDGSLLPITCRL
jgi:hypothetical protein